MAIKRITMQDIADACGLSRNTVSKIFNDRGAVPETTRQLVLAKAQELGYYAYAAAPQQPEVSMASMASAAVAAPKNIAVLSSSNPLNHHFGAHFIKAFTDTVCRDGYTVQMCELSQDELAQHRLPPNITLSNTLGILGIELFDEGYIRHLCTLGVPTLFVDAFCGASCSLLPSDVVSMENLYSSYAITKQMIENGASSLGFVGDIRHCNSFYERWLGFCRALNEAGITPDPALCIHAPDGAVYADSDWTIAQLNRMPRLPDAFFCANDYHAIKIILALKKMGLSVPQDALVAGFGDGPECAIVDPPLTTANIPNAELGMMAADILLRRAAYPDLPYGFSYVQTKPVFRSSTAPQNR